VGYRPHWANDWPTIAVNQTRTFVLERNKKGRKMVADAVAIEPVSASNSLVTGKRTGNFAISERFRASADPQAHRFKGLSARILYPTEQGISEVRIGNFRQDQGISAAITNQLRDVTFDTDDSKFGQHVPYASLPELL
jgi:hypothetical protein